MHIIVLVYLRPLVASPCAYNSAGAMLRPLVASLCAYNSAGVFEALSC